MPRPAIIAIDGPVAAGKTSVGKLVARRLNYRFLDTGIMYRAITWLAIKKGIDREDEAALGRLARETVIRLGEQDDDAITIDGREVAEELREPEVDRAVSLVARLGDVRSALVEQQREIAKGGQIVVAGRDIGTVVLPRADLKLFLLASVSERANRRYLELTEQGYSGQQGQVLKDLKARDQLDTGRELSPLRPAPDAVLLETDGTGVERMVEKVLELARED